MMRRSRFQNNSPNTSVLHLLLGISVFLCLWNLWSAPSSNQKEEEVAASRQYLSLSDGTTHHLVPLPLETIHGQQVIPISPHLKQLSSSTSDHAPRVFLLLNENQGPASTESQTKSPPVDTLAANIQTNQVPNSRTHFVAPSFARNVASGSVASMIHAKNSVASSRKLSNGAGITTTKSRSSSKGIVGTIILLAVSASVLAGGMMAKRALDKVQKWEQESQEDSLAYDLAYTSTMSEAGYGSFVSQWTDDDLDKFDV